MSKIGHNGPPADDDAPFVHRMTLILGRDENGDRTLEWEQKGRQIAPLPGLTRSGHMRPARDYALERAHRKLSTTSKERSGTLNRDHR